MNGFLQAMISIGLLCVAIVGIGHTNDLRALRQRVEALEKSTNTVERITIYGQNQEKP